MKNKILVDTGVLEGSIRWVTRPGELEIGVDQMGESTRNAHVHQFGFSGAVSIPVHTREIKQAFGIPLPEPKTVTVKAHSRNMNIPQRAFLGIDDMDKADMREVAVDYLRSLKDG